MKRERHHRTGDALIPARFQDTAAARGRFGDQLDRLAPFLLRVDPLADAVVDACATMPRGQGFRLLEAALARGIDAVPDAPAEVRALFAAVDHVPLWVDWEAVRRGGTMFLRTGVLGRIVLAMQSLILGYASPGGNKPLVLSGRLREQAARRLAETGRFVHAVSQPGGMRRSGEGFAITVKVRVMHAQVRRLVRASGGWQTALWGEPINQHDMVATALLFSVAVLDGLDKLGYRVSPAQREELVHLWRYVAYVIGVEPELIPGSYAEALRLAEMIFATQGAPDDDSRALVDALLHHAVRGARTERERRRAEQVASVFASISRAVLGEALADQLGVPRSRSRLTVPLVRAVAAASSRAHAIPSLQDLAFALGDRHWQRTIALGLGGHPADFAPPERFVGTRA
ncbi:oxygenase MpaB family protein [Sorangium sp. So ce1036]|uniref:oxygenase MpaB family protein n=1 Tax=Sorangium sp. So ce1036 TaxID=3133328 RepID=UPI003EFED21D